MEHRRAGHSGLTLSVLGLSTRSWGRSVDSDAAAAALAAFRDAGGTFVDTTVQTATRPATPPAGAAGAAGAAGRDGAPGRAESVLGALLTGDRDAMTIAAAAPVGAVGTVGAAVPASSRTALLGGLTDTLRRLRCEHVDLWQVPAALGEVPVHETLAALDAAVTSGKVRYIGLSEPVAWRLAQAATWQQAWPGRTPIAADQLPYSLLDRTAETDVVPAAVELGVGVICRAGAPSTAADAAADARTAGLIEAVATAADGLATTALAVSLSWLRGRPAVTSMVVDARTPAHLNAALSSLALTIPEPIRRVLDEVSAPTRRAASG